MVNRLPPSDMPSTPAGGTLLALGLDEAYTRGALLENIRGRYRLAAWHTVLRQGERHLADPIAEFCRQLGRQLGRRLWDEAAGSPLLLSDDPVRHPPLAHVALALNPRTPLRVWIAALTPGYSAEAVHVTVSSISAIVAGSTHLTGDCTAEVLGQAITGARPDVIVLAGGYDNQDPTAHRPALFLAAVVAGALTRLPRRSRPAVIYAGNQFAAEAVQARLQSANTPVILAPNVMPSPGTIRQDALALALESYYAQLCERIDGYAVVARWHTCPAPMTTIESNFVRLVQTWRALHNLADLHGIHCGADVASPWGRPRLHVWAGESDDTLAAATAIRYVETNAPLPADWPAPALVSGAWTDRASFPSGVRWWDRSGLAPIVAALGTGAPAAVQQTLTHDLFVARP